MAKTKRKWLYLDYNHPDALRAEDIPYDSIKSVKLAIDTAVTGGTGVQGDTGVQGQTGAQPGVATNSAAGSVFIADNNTFNYPNDPSALRADDSRLWTWAPSGIHGILGDATVAGDATVGGNLKVDGTAQFGSSLYTDSSRIWGSQNIEILSDTSVINHNFKAENLYATSLGIGTTTPRAREHVYNSGADLGPDFTTAGTVALFQNSSEYHTNIEVVGRVGQADGVSNIILKDGSNNILGYMNTANTTGGKRVLSLNTSGSTLTQTLSLWDNVVMIGAFDFLHVDNNLAQTKGLILRSAGSWVLPSLESDNLLTITGGNNARMTLLTQDPSGTQGINFGSGVGAPGDSTQGSFVFDSLNKWFSLYQDGTFLARFICSNSADSTMQLGSASLSSSQITGLTRPAYDVIDTTANGQTEFVLSYVPVYPETVSMIPVGGFEFVNNVDFSVSDSTITYLDISPSLSIGDTFIFKYFRGI